MKKIIVCLFTLLFLHLAKGQLVLNLQLPATGIYIKSQLWNFSIINTTAQNMSIKIEMTFSEASSGHQIFNASSRLINVSQQVTQLQARDLTPIVYNVIDPTYNQDINPDGLLPVGNFDVCFSVNRLNGEVFEKVAEDCESIQVEPLSPPILLNPPDEEEVETTRPFFTWIPPSPITGFTYLTYDYVLVEVGGNQLAADAIQQNAPLFSRQNLNNNSILYPSTLAELDTAKTYAWQVSANSNNNPIAKSEIWTFRLKKGIEATKTPDRNMYYSPLRPVNDASFTTQVGSVSFEYLNEINDSVATIKIFDLTQRSQIPILPAGGFLPLSLGENFLDLDLSHQAGIINNHVYLLEFTNGNNKQWYLKFEYRNPISN